MRKTLGRGDRVYAGQTVYANNTCEETPIGKAFTVKSEQLIINEYNTIQLVGIISTLYACKLEVEVDPISNLSIF